MAGFWFLMGAIAMGVFACLAVAFLDWQRNAVELNHRLKWFFTRSPIFYAWVGIAGIFLVTWFFIWQWGVNLLRPQGEQELTVEDLRNLLLGLGATVAAPVGLLTLANGRQRNRIMDEQKNVALKQEQNEASRLNADLFARAVELLAKNEDANKLGGLYSFERLFFSAEEDVKIQIFETISAFVRTESQRLIKVQHSNASAEDSEPKVTEPLKVAINIAIEMSSSLSRIVEFSNILLTGIFILDLRSAKVFFGDVVCGNQIEFVGSNTTVRIYGSSSIEQLSLRGFFQNVGIFNSSFVSLRLQGHVKVDTLQIRDTRIDRFNFGSNTTIGSVSLSGIVSVDVYAANATGITPNALSGITVVPRWKIVLPSNWSDEEKEQYWTIVNATDARHQPEFDNLDP